MKTSLKALLLTWNAVSPKINANETVYAWNHKVNISLFMDSTNSEMFLLVVLFLLFWISLFSVILCMSNLFNFI